MCSSGFCISTFVLQQIYDKKNNKNTRNTSDVASPFCSPHLILIDFKDRLDLNNTHD